MNRVVLCGLFLLLLCSCNQNKTANYDKIATDETVSKYDHTSRKMESLEPQIWIDNFLSNQKKDTLTVTYWSKKSKKSITEVPVDDVCDWWGWYQEQDICAILTLGNIEPLYLDLCIGLTHCFPIYESGRQAIVVVPFIAQATSWTMCKIYEINDNKWVELHNFSINPSFNNGTSVDECIIKRNGRWMYASGYDLMEKMPNPYRFVF